MSKATEEEAERGLRGHLFAHKLISQTSHNRLAGYPIYHLAARLGNKVMGSETQQAETEICSHLSHAACLLLNLQAQRRAKTWGREFKHY